jgi:hypothetical protein
LGLELGRLSRAVAVAVECLGSRRQHLVRCGVVRHRLVIVVARVRVRLSVRVRVGGRGREGSG